VTERIVTVGGFDKSACGWQDISIFVAMRQDSFAPGPQSLFGTLTAAEAFSNQLTESGVRWSSYSKPMSASSAGAILWLVATLMTSAGLPTAQAGAPKT
jgi:hypothetical protein